jgi:DNA-binding protein
MNSTQQPPRNQNQQNRENENIVRLSSRSNVRGVIKYIVDLFNSNRHDFVTISGLNQAISNVVLVAEVIKTQIPGLHQTNTIDCVVMTTDRQGNEGVERRTPKLEIVLARTEPTNKTNGYQRPYTQQEVQAILCNIMFNSSCSS